MIDLKAWMTSSPSGGDTQATISDGNAVAWLRAYRVPSATDQIGIGSTKGRDRANRIDVRCDGGFAKTRRQDTICGVEP